MEKDNTTLVLDFILTGLTYQQEWQIPLFLMFLVIYLMTMMGNLGLIILIWNDSQLHIPMYLFLGNLAFIDASLSSTVTPKMLVDFFSKNKMISFTECMIQFFSFAIGVTTECFLLACMAYDRYVAICKPLQYPIIMSNRLCFCLSVSSFGAGIFHAFLHTGLALRLTFCNDNVIQHFYCDVEPLFKISCTDPSINILIVYIVAGFIQVVTITTVLVSYTIVLCTILKNKSLEGMKKAFSTCGAHILCVALYYVPLIFIYMHPRTEQSSGQDITFSVFYTIIIPLLNPIIYSLRNKKVIDSFVKILKRNI
ncbi:olfactory receptor 5H2-like [Suncus etruscus]|uniref:olfactory receptor 5H2-like n=1 Tax=Suncus etruscus TaxID=109475 RepID=UPI00210F49CC|nr:olfactory receptor 5H2-like [Suncus etruscus]